MRNKERLREITNEQDGAEMWIWLYETIDQAQFPQDIWSHISKYFYRIKTLKKTSNHIIHCTPEYCFFGFFWLKPTPTESYKPVLPICYETYLSTDSSGTYRFIEKIRKSELFKCCSMYGSPLGCTAIRGKGHVLHAQCTPRNSVMYWVFFSSHSLVSYILQQR